MRAKSRGLVAAVCLLVATAAYGAIDRVSPSTIAFGNVEEFVTIYGSGLYGTETTLVVFDGSRTIEPSLASPDGTSLTVWVPAAVLYEEGRHTVEVQVTNVGGTPQTIGLGYLNIDPNPEDRGGSSLPPFINVPEIAVGEASTENGGPVTFEVIGTSRNGDPAQVTCDHSSGSSFPMGLSLVSCTATDDFGSTAGSFAVLVTDTTAPVVTVPADIVSPTATVTFSASAIDNIDGPLNVTCSPASGSTFAVGTTIVRCAAFDLHANAGYAAFRVTTEDGAPEITVPADISTPATSASGASVTFTATATGNATITCSPASGATFPIGDTTVTCTATNAAGSSSGTFQVTVTDGPPTLTVPVDITAEGTSAAGAAVTFSATATDAVDGAITPVCTPASGTTFALGMTTVSCTATDSAGNEVSDTFTINVEDTTPPAFLVLTASTSVLWPPNHQMVNVDISAVVWDAVDPSPVTRIRSVSSNQPVNGTGDGDAAPDWVVTGPLSLQLRSERAGNVDRVYKIVVETSDASGNVAVSTVEVRVAQTKRRR
jgi:hypothetical protein